MINSRDISKKKAAAMANATKGKERTFDDKKTYKRNKNKKETKDIIEESEK